ncbi:hypothetical protein GlitD10_1003 [Gloeomargarita lithophora Alchichica-D10]|uniref:Uncharacterized protein n=2 Tax=Gloeomargarita TaxID=1188227 RepID=A0A1J0ABP3_9CYAN|nr:hypothetical protein GlitD10_1003 [Gloeomargarita lithophora Alchichica-D10]
MRNLATPPIVWVHGDSLSPMNPALLAYPQAPAVWVWDEELLTQWQISRKRIVFIYECLLELPVEIRRGNVLQELTQFVQEQGSNKLVTTQSPSPHFKQICQELSQQFTLEILPIPPLIPPQKYLDLKRFSRYWQVAERQIYPH